MISGNTQNYFSGKYDSLYMQIAEDAAKYSVAKRKKVGAAIVLPSGLISVGWNGTPSGFDNACEGEDGLTLPTVIHAEHNAIKKLLMSGTSIQGAVIYITLTPCIQCSLMLVDLGVSRVVYKEEYHCNKGLQMLHEGGVKCSQYTGSAGG